MPANSFSIRHSEALFRTPAFSSFMQKPLLSALSPPDFFVER